MCVATSAPKQLWLGVTSRQGSVRRTISSNIPHDVRVHQSYLEPMATVAQYEPGGKLTIWTSTQGTYVGARGWRHCWAANA